MRPNGNRNVTQQEATDKWLVNANLPITFLLVTISVMLFENVPSPYMQSKFYILMVWMMKSSDSFTSKLCCRGLCMVAGCICCWQAMHKGICPPWNAPWHLANAFEAASATAPLSFWLLPLHADQRVRLPAWGFLLVFGSDHSPKSRTSILQDYWGK